MSEETIICGNCGVKINGEYSYRESKTKGFWYEHTICGDRM